jgi:lipopolysaccharide/colanic/teichoic acid biosynthesis glycosyltransferase
MSIVGPRPEVPEYVQLYNDEQRRILNVKPGITDYASLAYFSENELLAKSDNPERTYIEEIMPAKIKLNEQYIMNPTLSQDIKIMWLTFRKIMRV